MGILDALLEGFAAQATDPLPAAKGAFTVGDRVNVSVPGRQSLAGTVRRPHAAAPDTHVVIAPEGGGPHVVAPISSVRLNTPRQHADAARRAERQALQGKPGDEPLYKSDAPAGRPQPVREGVGVLLEAFAAGNLETPAQSQAIGARQAAQAQAQLRAGWNASKHPRATGGRFGYTTGGKRAKRGKASSSRTLAAGSRGALVQSIQRQLGIPEDGKYGPQTRAAVVRYQRQHGLQVDGVVGAQTLASLRGHVNARLVAPGPISSRAARLAAPRAAKAPSRKGQAKIPAQPSFGGGVLVGS